MQPDADVITKAQAETVADQVVAAKDAEIASLKASLKVQTTALNDAKGELRMVRSAVLAGLGRRAKADVPTLALAATLVDERREDRALLGEAVEMLHPPYGLAFTQTARTYRVKVRQHLGLKPQRKS